MLFGIMDDTTASSSNTHTGDNNPPELPPDSPGSSVSSELQEEYDEILKYAVVIPSYDPEARPKKLKTVKSSFLEDERPRQPPNPTAAAERVRFADEAKEPSPVSSNSQEHAIDDDVDYRCHDDGNPRPYPVTMKTVTMVVPDFPRMENVLDEWYAELKERVMAELRRVKSEMADGMHQQLAAERKRHLSETGKLQDDVVQLRHLVQAYETSVQRKDDVIANLTRTLEHEKTRREELRCLWECEARALDDKREEFCTVMAILYYKRNLCKKVYHAWRSLITSRWQQRVEKACQARAAQICVNLTDEYEHRINKLEEELTRYRDEVKRLNEERDLYEETMKKAFMRGVCALNVEAMNMFQESERREFRETLQAIADVTGRMSPCRQAELPPRVVRSPTTGGATAPVRTVHFAPFSKSSCKTIKPRAGGHVTASGHVTVNPPMSSVVVERHQPVTKQTISHAVAAMYPRDTQPSNQKPAQYPRDAHDAQPSNQKPVELTSQKPCTTPSANQKTFFKRIAGQQLDCTKTISHVTSVKVEES